MKSVNIFLLIGLVFGLTMTSCKKEDGVDTLEKGNVSLDFDHVWGSSESEFLVNKELTHPMLGEKMTFSLFKYYVSNIRMKKTDGTWWTMPESYYIVDAATEAGKVITIPDVPGGEYTDIEVMYGVDSLRSVSGAQTGALAPSNGMFWSWNSGYIMLKAEGTAPSSADGTFAFHLGGFKGINKVQTTKTYSLGGKLVVNGSRKAEIHMIANPARLWHGAQKLSEKPKEHMPGPLAKSMTANFYDVIRFDHIHN